MSIECGECERDLRGGHDDDCSRAQKCPECKTVVTWKNCTPAERLVSTVRKCKCGKTAHEEEW